MRNRTRTQVPYCKRHGNYFLLNIIFRGTFVYYSIPFQKILFFFKAKIHQALRISLTEIFCLTCRSFPRITKHFFQITFVFSLCPEGEGFSCDFSSLSCLVLYEQINGAFSFSLIFSLLFFFTFFSFFNFENTVQLIQNTLY